MPVIKFLHSSDCKLLLLIILLLDLDINEIYLHIVKQWDGFVFIGNLGQIDVHIVWVLLACVNVKISDVNIDFFVNPDIEFWNPINIRISVLAYRPAFAQLVA